MLLSAPEGPLGYVSPSVYVTTWPTRRPLGGRLSGFGRPPGKAVRARGGCRRRRWEVEWG